MGDAGYAVVDFGRFVTGFLVVMGIALPVMLAHCALIQVPAMAMSIIGGEIRPGLISGDQIANTRQACLFTGQSSASLSFSRRNRTFERLISYLGCRDDSADNQRRGLFSIYYLKASNATTVFTAIFTFWTPPSRKLTGCRAAGRTTPE